MSARKELVIKPCKRFKRRLIISQEDETLGVRLTGPGRNDHHSLAFDLHPANRCSVMMGSHEEDKGTLIIGLGVHFPMTWTDAERVAREFSLRKWYRDNDVHVPIPDSAMQPHQS